MDLTPIKKKMHCWKKVFTGNCGDDKELSPWLAFAEPSYEVDASSSWMKIFHALSPSEAMLLCLINKATTYYGTFTASEEKILRALPYYNYVIALLKIFPTKQEKLVAYFDKAQIKFIRHYEFEDKGKNVPFIEVRITLKQASSKLKETDIFIRLECASGSKNVVINYYSDKDKLCQKTAMQEKGSTERKNTLQYQPTQPLHYS